MSQDCIQWVKLPNMLIPKNLLVFNVGICICLYKIELLFGTKIETFRKCVRTVHQGLYCK